MIYLIVGSQIVRKYCVTQPSFQYFLSLCQTLSPVCILSHFKAQIAQNCTVLL